MNSEIVAIIIALLFFTGCGLAIKKQGLDLDDKCDYDDITQELLCYPRVWDQDLDDGLTIQDRRQLDGGKRKEKK